MWTGLKVKNFSRIQLWRGPHSSVRFTSRSSTRFSHKYQRKISSCFLEGVGGGGGTISEYNRALCSSYQGLPSGEASSLEPNVLGTYQSLTDLRERKCPAPASQLPVPPRARGERNQDSGGKFTVQKHRVTKRQRCNHRTVVLSSHLTTIFLKVFLFQLLFTFSTSPHQFHMYSKVARKPCTLQNGPPTAWPHTQFSQH